MVNANRRLGAGGRRPGGAERDTKLLVEADEHHGLDEHVTARVLPQASGVGWDESFEGRSRDVEIVGGVLVVLVLSGVLASQLLVFPAMWRGLDDQWRRSPADRRRRGLVGGVLAGVWLVVCAGLGIAAPWGHYTLVYVVGVGVGAWTVLGLSTVAVLTGRERRRARRLRAERSEAGRNRREAGDKGSRP
jgi:MFS family permease